MSDATRAMKKRPLTLIDAVKRGNGDLARRLLREGAAPDQIESRTGRAVMHHACTLRRPDLVELLLDHGADPNLRDVTGTPPVFAHDSYFHNDSFEIDGSREQRRIIQLLVDRGLDLESQESNS